MTGRNEMATMAPKAIWTTEEMTGRDIDMNRRAAAPRTKSKVKKIIRRVLLGILAALAAVIVIFIGVYFTRFQTMSSIEKLSSYEDGYDLYHMNVVYDYDLDKVISRGITDDQSMFDSMVKGALPLLPIKIQAPKFGCSAFTLECADGEIHMGRNYDFKTDTSAMMVYCSPKDGYRSVAFAALSNLKANQPLDSVSKKMTSLIAPYVCLDGMNEKGVSIAVLTLDSEPVHQDTGKPTIATSLAIRLVLDRAATTEEAVELLRSYDMYASTGRDYHFYITDASGDGRAIEWDCESETREMVATPVNAVTNFFALYTDKVQPGERNVYGHGKDRYEAILEVFEEQEGNYTDETGWDALKAAAQDPNPEELTSNTQWSILFNNTDLTAEIVIRRNWDDVYTYDLNSDTVNSPTADEDVAANRSGIIMKESGSPKWILKTAVNEGLQMKVVAKGKVQMRTIAKGRVQMKTIASGKPYMKAAV